jgi:hypothetical protein
LFSILPAEGIPNIVVIGVPDLKALERVLAKLKLNQIQHFAWTEPDYDLGMTAIATVPLDEKRKQCLMNYRLLKFAGGAEKSACDRTVDSGSNSPGLNSATNGVCLQ